MIDLRSDTVTKPTDAMRRAMAEAEVGDDVFGEDPTVNRLEALGASRMGKEAGLFVASGTMGNLVAELTHCQRGDEMIVGDRAHNYLSEVGGASALGGVSVRTIPNAEDGSLPLDKLEAAFRPPNVHVAPTALVCLENTHNHCGGTVLTPEQTQATAKIVHERGAALHLDGARIFNAATYLGVSAAVLAEPADSVSFCLSKGLSAPVGSVLCGSTEFIARARRVRKMLGGGMRQAGVIAAAGIVALETMVDRLAEDHDNARVLAEGLAEIPGLRVEPARVQTNIVLVDLDNLMAAEFLQALAAKGVQAVAFGPRRVRFVTHYGIERKDVEKAVDGVAAVMAEA